MFFETTPRIKGDIGLVEMDSVAFNRGAKSLACQKIRVDFDTVKCRIAQENIRSDLRMLVEIAAQSGDEKLGVPGGLQFVR